MENKKTSKRAAGTFTPISEADTREIRKRLNLPITKPLRYMEYISLGRYEEHMVCDYEIVSEYDSGSCTLNVIIDNGKTVAIHSQYFADMQKASFVNDMQDASSEE